jgi:hypothetical protein
VGAGRALAWPEHDDFKAEAVVFPHGADDLFDACMGALTALLHVTDATSMEEAFREQVRTKRERRSPESPMYEPGGEGSILGERL